MVFDESEVRAEVARRNEVRRKAGMALLDVEIEVSHLRQDQGACNEDEALEIWLRENPALEARAKAEILAEMQQIYGPAWSPKETHSGPGWLFHRKVQNMLKRKFRDEKGTN